MKKHIELDLRETAENTATASYHRLRAALLAGADEIKKLAEQNMAFRRFVATCKAFSYSDGMPHHESFDRVEFDKLCALLALDTPGNPSHPPSP